MQWKLFGNMYELLFLWFSDYIFQARMESLLDLDDYSAELKKYKNKQNIHKLNNKKKHKLTK